MGKEIAKCGYCGKVKEIKLCEALPTTHGQSWRVPFCDDCINKYRRPHKSYEIMLPEGSGHRRYVILEEKLW